MRFRHLGILVALGKGVLAALALGLLAGALRAQGSDQAIYVCVGSDRVLRLVAFDKPCSPDQQRLLISKAQADDPAPEPDKPESRKESSEARIRHLEERVRELEKKTDKSRETKFRVPFIVSDEGGKPIFIIKQTPVGPSVELQDAGMTRVQLGIGGSSGTNALRFYNKSGPPGAAFGVGPDGSGAINLQNTEGSTTVHLQATPARLLLGRGGPGLATLAVGNNGGKLELADSGGRITAEGGVLPTGSGVFRVRGKVFQYIAGDGMRLPAW
jgi:hypothetical protein